MNKLLFEFCDERTETLDELLAIINMLAITTSLNKEGRSGGLAITPIPVAFSRYDWRIHTAIAPFFLSRFIL